MTASSNRIKEDKFYKRVTEDKKVGLTNIKSTHNAIWLVIHDKKIAKASLKELEEESKNNRKKYIMS